MPIYSYKCKNCNKSFEITAPMKNWNKKRKCPDCGKQTFRDVVAEHSGGNVDSQMKDYQFEGSTGTRMYAAAYLKGQENEMKKKHPGREFRWYNNCWLPVIKNRTDKMKYLKERDYVEF